MHRIYTPPPSVRRPGVELIANVACATALGLLLAAALVHWWSCEGMC